MMTKNIFLIFLLFSVTTLSFSQTDDFTKDSIFFNNQAKRYQTWLNHSGIGKKLQVKGIDLQAQKISLYLSFPFNDTDSVTMAWRQLKREFERESPVKIEEKLFYQMVHMMGINQDMGNIQLYDVYDLRLEPCFFQGIYFESEAVKIDSFKCRSKSSEIKFEASDFTDMKRSARGEVFKIMSKKEAFDRIYSFANNYFSTKICKQNKPRIRLLESKRYLRFEVIDLCRIVLTDESQPTLCRILRTFGHNCDWVKREMLNFTFTYETIDDGFLLTCNIEGKYGSGHYDTVKRGGYIDMEIDFDEYLEAYAEEFKELLRKALSNG